jgi:hypothetical protein
MKLFSLVFTLLSFNYVYALSCEDENALIESIRANLLVERQVIDDTDWEHADAFYLSKAMQYISNARSNLSLAKCKKKIILEAPAEKSDQLFDLRR